MAKPKPLCPWKPHPFISRWVHLLCMVSPKHSPKHSREIRRVSQRGFFLALVPTLLLEHRNCYLWNGIMPFLVKTQFSLKFDSELRQASWELGIDPSPSSSFHPFPSASYCYVGYTSLVKITYTHLPANLR